jgi:hypothetical protein
MVWAEHRHRHNQVRRCYCHCRLGIDILQILITELPKCIAWMTKSSKQMSTQRHIRPRNLLVPASFQDGWTWGHRSTPFRQAMPERGYVSPPSWSSSFSDMPAPCCTGPSKFSYPSASLSPLSKQLSTSRSSSGNAHVCWNTAGANGDGSDLSGAASDAGLNPTQVHHVT